MRQVTRVTHPSAAQSNRKSSEESFLSASLDLHVLSTPPAFILSQDQTLVKSVCIQFRINILANSSLLLLFGLFKTVLKNLLLKEIFKGYCCLLFNYQGSFCVFSSDSFYILSKAFLFVKNFFNFFKVFYLLYSFSRVSLDIIPFVLLNVNTFFQKVFHFSFEPVLYHL